MGSPQSEGLKYIPSLWPRFSAFTPPPSLPSPFDTTSPVSVMYGDLRLEKTQKEEKVFMEIIIGMKEEDLHPLTQTTGFPAERKGPC